MPSDHTGRPGLEHVRDGSFPSIPPGPRAQGREDAGRVDQLVLMAVTDPLPR